MNLWNRRWYCLEKKIHLGKDVSSVIIHLNYLGKCLTYATEMARISTGSSVVNADNAGLAQYFG